VEILAAFIILVKKKRMPCLHNKRMFMSSLLLKNCRQRVGRHGGARCVWRAYNAYRRNKQCIPLVRVAGLNCAEGYWSGSSFREHGAEWKQWGRLWLPVPSLLLLLQVVVPSYLVYLRHTCTFVDCW